MSNPYLQKNKVFNWKYLVIAASWPILTQLCEIIPQSFGLYWIPGWPKFCMELAAFLLLLALSWLLFRHENRSKPVMGKKQKWLVGSIAVVFAVIFGAMLCLRYLSGYPKTVEYQRSPDGADTQVVLENRYGFKTVHPVRLKVFYEIDNYRYEW